MKQLLPLISIIILIFVFNSPLFAQCSICTKTAQQLGEGPAKGLNTGIIYMAFAPLVILGVLGYSWWKRNGQIDEPPSSHMQGPSQV